MTSHDERKRLKGLYLICALDLWERFSFHGMRALLVLFLVASIGEGGFNWSQKDALQTYGTYLALVYIAPLAVAPLIDRLTGHYRGVVIGSLIILVGHISLAAVHLVEVLLSPEGFKLAIDGASGSLAKWSLPQVDGALSADPQFQAAYFGVTISFYFSLACIIIGTGFFKSGVGSLISRLYADASDTKREAAFTREYMLINIGAFIAPLALGFVGAIYGWHYAFSLAAIGMAAGLVLFLVGSRSLLPDHIKTQKYIPRPPTDEQNTSDDQLLTPNILLLGFLIVIISIYWAVYEQWGGLLNIFTDQRINRQAFGIEIPAASLQALGAFFIIGLAPLLVFVNTRLDHKPYMKKSITPFYKLGLACIALGVAFILFVGAELSASLSQIGMASLWWLIFGYFFMSLSEIILAPVAISLFTRLAPAAYLSLAIGLYYGAGAVGAFFSGYIGALAEPLGSNMIFGALALTGFSLAVIVVVFGLIFCRGDRLYGSSH